MRVAIVFEHAGGSLADLAPIDTMYQPFGLGIFPRMRYWAQIAHEGEAHGLTPVLHLPLESRNPADMGNGDRVRADDRVPQGSGPAVEPAH